MKCIIKMNSFNFLLFFQISLQLAIFFFIYFCAYEYENVLTSTCVYIHAQGQFLQHIECLSCTHTTAGRVGTLSLSSGSDTCSVGHGSSLRKAAQFQSSTCHNLTAAFVLTSAKIHLCRPSRSDR